MANKKLPKKTKPKYTAAQRRAYWIGVGISAERHGDGDKVLDSSNIAVRNSARNGYSDDNHKDLSSKLSKTR